jgi:hypothetical protein
MSTASYPIDYSGFEKVSTLIPIAIGDTDDSGRVPPCHPDAVGVVHQYQVHRLHYEQRRFSLHIVWLY